MTQAQADKTAVQYQILTPGEVDLGRAGRVFEYWESCRGSAIAPRWGSDFRLYELPADILPNISVVDVLDGGERYYYRFWGTNNVVIKGFEMSQKYLEQSPVESVRTNGYHQFGVMVRERRPLVFLYEAVYRAEVNVGCVTLRLPLSSDGVTVDKIASYQDLNMRRNAWQNLFDTLREQPLATAP